MGNPGTQYVYTRHNIGFRVVDRIAEKQNRTWKKRIFRPFVYCKTVRNKETLFIVKPLTYMNRSGDILPTVLRISNMDVENLLIVCDTLDLPFGICRLKRKGGSAGHKGLDSILRIANTDDIMRLYIGIGRPPLKSDVIRYVLEVPKEEEASAYTFAIEQSAQAIEDLLTTPLLQVMNELNKRT